MVILTQDLRSRVLTPELMDDPALDARRHELALRGLARINRFSRSASTLWSAIAPLAAGFGRPLRVLDVATGGGDVPINLLLLARRANIPLEADGCDISETALSMAARRAAALGVPLGLHRIDATRDPVPEGYDAVVASLFTHHLPDEQVTRLLRRAAAAAGMSVIINDLRRSRAGLALAWFGSRILSRSNIVHTDAVLSVRAAFTPTEMLCCARAAGLENATITPVFPVRMLLTWRRS